MKTMFTSWQRWLVGSFLLLFTGIALAASVNVPATLFYPSLNTVAGNPSGKVTVVEFFDYRCEYCRQMPPILARLISQNPNVRIVYREYPILGPVSQFAAQAALAATMQRKYLPFHADMLGSDAPLSQSSILAIAKQNGLNVPALTQAMSSGAVAQQIRTNFNLAQRVGLSGVPSCVVAVTPRRGAASTPAQLLLSPDLGDLNSAIAAVTTG